MNLDVGRLERSDNISKFIEMKDFYVGQVTCKLQVAEGAKARKFESCLLQAESH
jgi:hypothetical protein